MDILRDYMRSGEDITYLPRQYWRSLLVHAYKSGVSTEAQIKDACLGIGEHKLCTGPSTNEAFISKVMRMTAFKFHPDREHDPVIKAAKQSLLQDLNDRADNLKSTEEEKHRPVFYAEKDAAKMFVYLKDRQMRL